MIIIILKYHIIQTVTICFRWALRAIAHVGFNFYVYKQNNRENIKNS